MANSTVNPQATRDSISANVAKAIGIADLLRHASPEHLASDTLANAGDALIDLLREVDMGIGSLQVAAA
jgi:hypothetical protein